MLQFKRKFGQMLRCKISARVPHPASRCSATFPRGEGIGAAGCHLGEGIGAAGCTTLGEYIGAGAINCGVVATGNH